MSVDTKRARVAAERPLYDFNVIEGKRLLKSLADEVDRLKSELDDYKAHHEADTDEWTALESERYDHGECENSLGLLREKHDALLAAAKADLDTLDGRKKLALAARACEEKP